MNQHRQYDLMADALHWLVANQQHQPSLGQLSEHIGLSQSHLQRTFQAFVGVSPKQFLKYLTKEQALMRLQHGATVLNAALDCGLSGTGRLHDLMVSTEAMTPGEARQSGRGVRILHGFGITPFGEVLLGWTTRGINFLAFCYDKGRREALRQLQQQWSGASFTESGAEAQNLAQQIFTTTREQPLRVWLRGSPFQLKVWEALLAIPPGTHCTYGQIAAFLDRPRASRAVGSAVGRNPVSWLIPCHRVITSLGTPGGYRWGIGTKRALIAYEAARAAA
jgi:AraC family transcriptional regulator of adaptative response/methylated-DNA-[protein]-cysteine methyltransferase